MFSIFAASLLISASAQLYLNARLSFVLFVGEPLEIAELVTATANQGLPVIDLPARTWAARGVIGWTWVHALELGAQDTRTWRRFSGHRHD